MIGVVPTPVLSTSVVIVKDPLKTFKILKKHFPLEVDSIRCSDILLQLGLIVECLGFYGVHGEFLNQTRHELQVLLTVLVNQLLLHLDLGILCNILLLHLQLIHVDLRLVNITYFIIRNVIWAEVTKILLLYASNDIFQNLILGLLLLNGGSIAGALKILLLQLLLVEQCTEFG